MPARVLFFARIPLGLSPPSIFCVIDDRRAVGTRLHRFSPSILERADQGRQLRRARGICLAFGHLVARLLVYCWGTIAHAGHLTRDRAYSARATRCNLVGRPICAFEGLLGAALVHAIRCDAQEGCK